MVYATQADIEARFGRDELVDLTNPHGEDVDAVKVEIALADAEATVNVRLASQYALPLSKTPEILTRITVNIARKHLYELDGRIVTDTVKENYDESIQMLKEIAKGTLELGVTKEGSVLIEKDTVQVQSSSQVFTSETLKGY